MGSLRKWFQFSNIELSIDSTKFVFFPKESAIKECYRAFLQEFRSTPSLKIDSSISPLSFF